MAGQGLLAALRRLSTVLAAEAIGRLVAFVAVIATARLLNPADFGGVTVAVTVLGICYQLADAGLGESAVQRFTGMANARESFRREVAAARLLLAIVLSIGMVLATWPLVATGRVPATVPIVCAALPPWVAASNVVYELRVRQRISAAAWLNAAFVAVPAAGPILLLGFGATSVHAAFGIALAAVTLLVLTAFYARPQGPATQHLRQHLKPGGPFLTVSLAVIIYSRIDRLAAGLIGGLVATGIYSAAYSLVLAAIVLGGAVQFAYTPVALTHWRSGTFRRSRVIRHLAILWTLGLTGAGLVAALAEPILRIAFGPAYVDGVEVLRILALLAPLYIVNPYLSLTLIAQNRERLVSRVALVNLAVALSLYGLAVATDSLLVLACGSVATEAIGSVLMTLAVMRPRRDSSQLPTPVADPRTAPPSALRTGRED